MAANGFLSDTLQIFKNFLCIRIRIRFLKNFNNYPAFIDNKCGSNDSHGNLAIKVLFFPYIISFYNI